MKIFLAILMLLTGFAPVVMAQQEAGYAPEAEEAGNGSIMKGVVVSVTPGDAGRKIRAELRLTSETGEVWFFLVSDSASVLGKDGKEIALSEIKPGHMVSLDYVIYRYGRGMRGGAKVSPRKVFEAEKISVH